MGRSYTPKYRVELKAVGSYLSGGAWNVRDYGKTTDANLAEYVAKLNESFEPGGVNFHGDGETIIVRVHSAKIVRQADDEVVASYTAPMFEVVS